MNVQIGPEYPAAASRNVSEYQRYHRDPFDRGLVLQAILPGLTIMPSDPLIALYPAPVLWL